MNLLILRPTIGGKHRPAIRLGVVTMMLFGSVATAEGQTIRGRVVDASTGTGVAQAAVVVATGERIILTTFSDSLGNFLAQLPETETLAVHAERIGYVRSDPVEFRMGMGAELDIRIVLEPDALPLDGVAVTGIRGARLAPAATVEGLHARRAVLPRVGSSRAFVHGDPEMQSVATVGQLLDRWIPFGGERRCVDWFVNGLPMHPFSDPREFVREMTTSMLEGVEYYRDDLSAPLEFHGRGWCSWNGGTYSIIAVWFKR